MKLYTLKGACSLVPHIALIWAKADFELRQMGRNELKSPEFLTLNPQGSVPFLQDGDFGLSQNIAIIQYIHEQFPKALLFGSGDLKAQSKARQWLAFCNSDVHKAFGGMFNPAGFVQDESLHTQVRELSAQKILNLYQIAQSALSHQDYLTGEFTIADVYLYVTLRWAKLLQLDVQAFEAFYQRVEQQHVVQSALQAEGLK